MAQRSIDIATERARAAGAAPTLATGPDGRTRTRRLAIGDPQAPLEKFLGVLDAHRALGPDGMLAPDVFLVSMGDHFDWGKREDREKATADGMRILAWLAAHPPDQAVILLGNHDLGRVGELVRFDDRAFDLARGEADVIYGDSASKDEAREDAFRKRHPDLPSAEIASRDFSTFCAAQRDLVTSLLHAKRFRIAYAASPSLMLCHAGVTDDELTALDVAPSARADAALVSDALNAALDSHVAAWDETTPLLLASLHEPGSGTTGEEGRGIFYHRPSNPAFEDAALFAGPPRRRFDPRRLPRGLVQAIGHIRDGKCRKLLPDRVDKAAATLDGPLRHLGTDGSAVRYARGVPQRWEAKDAGMIFLDGGMSHVDPSTYELLDLITGRPATK